MGDVLERPREAWGSRMPDYAQRMGDRRIRHALDACTAGSVAVNDCVFQFAQSRLPCGGIGPSGMGADHGHAGFLAFSKQMPVFRQSHWSAAARLRPPYGARVERLTRWLVR